MSMTIPMRKIDKTSCVASWQTHSKAIRTDCGRVLYPQFCQQCSRSRNCSIYENIGKEYSITTMTIGQRMPFLSLMLPLMLFLHLSQRACGRRLPSCPEQQKKRQDMKQDKVCSANNHFKIRLSRKGQLLRPNAELQHNKQEGSGTQQSKFSTTRWFSRRHKHWCQRRSLTTPFRCMISKPVSVGMSASSTSISPNLLDYSQRASVFFGPGPFAEHRDTKPICYAWRLHDSRIMFCRKEERMKMYESI